MTGMWKQLRIISSVVLNIFYPLSYRRNCMLLWCRVALDEDVLLLTLCTYHDYYLKKLDYYLGD